MAKLLRQLEGRSFVQGELSKLMQGCWPQLQIFLLPVRTPPENDDSFPS